MVGNAGSDVVGGSYVLFTFLSILLPVAILLGSSDCETFAFLEGKLADRKETDDMMIRNF
jgi:hypothetical protein